MKRNEVYRLMSALALLIGIFALDLLTPLALAGWIMYVFPIWNVARYSIKSPISLPFVTLVCTGLIVAGYFLLLPAMDGFVSLHHQTYPSNLLLN
jgi:hypothetical protein